MLLLWAPLAGVAGRRESESGRGGSGGPWGPGASPCSPPPRPPYGQPGAGGVGCAWKGGIGKTAPPPLPLPLSRSRAPVRRCARTPGNLAPAAPPLRGAQAPPPRSPPLPACQWVPGQWESVILGLSAGGHRGDALGKFSEPGAGVGGSAKGCRGSLPGRDVTVTLLVPGHRGGWGSNPLEVCALGSGGGDAATSLLSCCRWCGG